MIQLHPLHLGLVVYGAFYFGRKYGRMEAIALTRPIKFQPEENVNKE